MRTNPVRTPWTSDGWQAAALCRSSDASVFFAPSSVETKEQKDARESKAKGICRECPVRVDCLNHALDTREPYGIWGGMNELERRRLLAKRAG